MMSILRWLTSGTSFGVVQELTEPQPAPEDQAEQDDQRKAREQRAGNEERRKDGRMPASYRALREVHRDPDVPRENQRQREYDEQARPQLSTLTVCRSDAPARRAQAAANQRKTQARELEK